VSARPLSCCSDLLVLGVRSSAPLLRPERHRSATASASFRPHCRPLGVRELSFETSSDLCRDRHFAATATNPSGRPARIARGPNRRPSDVDGGVILCDTPESTELLSPSGVVQISGWRLVRTHAADAARVLPSRAPPRPLGASLLAAGAPPDRRLLGASLLAPLSPERLSTSGASPSGELGEIERRTSVAGLLAGVRMPRG
jgi:hypothetical protein